VRVLGGLRFRQVSVGLACTCGPTTANRLYCWGVNSDGQLGDGTRIDRLRPVPVSGRRQYRQLAAGALHTCAVTTSGRAFCWGFNGNGPLGIGSTAVRRLEPTPVAGHLLHTKVGVGYMHGCAVATGARAYCWGYGLHGAIGDRQTLDRSLLTAVAGGLSFERLTVGVYHTCGETTDNRTYCRGLNETGQLGDGTNDNFRNTPVRVGGGVFFSQVSAGSVHTCGRTPAATAYCWGSNDSGQLGDGTTTDRVVPVAVSAGP
jgi:alpha-tubulin suppressor-like RCC1 family protein